MKTQGFRERSPFQGETVGGCKCTGPPEVQEGAGDQTQRPGGRWCETFADVTQNPWKNMKIHGNSSSGAYLHIGHARGARAGAVARREPGLPYGARRLLTPKNLRRTNIK